MKNTRCTDNVVADAFWRIFEGIRAEDPEQVCATLLESLPRVYASLEEHKKEDPLCKDLWQKIRTGQGGVENFQIHIVLVRYCLKQVGSRRWMVSASLRAILLKYFRDAVLSGHLVTRKTLQRIAPNFWWPKRRAEIFSYVRKCDLCQRAKSAQDARGITLS